MGVALWGRKESKTKKECVWVGREGMHKCFFLAVKSYTLPVFLFLKVGTRKEIRSQHPESFHCMKSTAVFFLFLCVSSCRTVFDALGGGKGRGRRSHRRAPNAMALLHLVQLSFWVVAAAQAALV